MPMPGGRAARTGAVDRLPIPGTGGAAGGPDDAASRDRAATRAAGGAAPRALVKRLAMAKFRELRCAGLSTSEIVAQFGGEWGRPGLDATVQRRRGRRPGSARDRAGANADAGALVCALDAVDQGLAFFDRDGVLAHTNRAAERVLATHPDGARLRAELQHFASAVSGVVRLRRLGGTAGVEEIEARDVPTAAGPYRLRGSYLGLDLFGPGGCVLVAVERPGPRLLDAEELRRRFGLSAQESRIAHLLAAGRSNVGIAEALGISPHTARTHTQRVLEKLGVGARAQVATTILQRGG
jgi:DNA-binding CsgD family transcriptional regulator